MSDANKEIQKPNLFTNFFTSQLIPEYNKSTGIHSAKNEIDGEKLPYIFNQNSDSLNQLVYKHTLTTWIRWCQQQHKRIELSFFEFYGDFQFEIRYFFENLEKENIISQPIRARNAQFTQTNFVLPDKNKISFKQAFDVQESSFRSSKFENIIFNNCNFSKCYFVGEFVDCQFNNTQLDMTELNQLHIKFQNCNVQSKLTISLYKENYIQQFISNENTKFHNLIFDQVTFGSTGNPTQNFQFHKTTLVEVNFHKVTFVSNENSFIECIVNNLNFEESILVNGLLFQNIKFEKYESKITFKNIKDLANEAKIEFIFDLDKIPNKENIVNVEFDNCRFKPGQVVFKNCHLSGLKVKNMTYEAFRFENCTWKEKEVLCLPAMKVLNDGSTLQEVKDPQQVNFHIEKYADLKNKAKKDGNEQLASHFHFWYLYCKLSQMKEWLSFNKLVLFSYLHTCGFGLSVWRPFIWWLIVFLSFSFIYSSLFNEVNSFDFDLHCIQSVCCSIPKFVNAIFDFVKNSESLKVSFASSTTVFDPTKIIDNKQVHTWTLLTFFIQKVIQLFFLFEIGAAIRNKVKK